MEAGECCDDEAPRDVEDAPEAVGEVGHGQHCDPDTQELGHRVRVEQEAGVGPAQPRTGDTGVVETARHKLTPVDHALSVVLPDQGSEPWVSQHHETDLYRDNMMAGSRERLVTERMRVTVSWV